MNTEQSGELSNRDAPPCKGRILFIGASYYNTWYLSRELRSLGWHADMFVYGGEGSDAYMHGTDYSLKVMEGPFPEFDDQFRDCIQELAAEYVRWVREKCPKKENRAWGAEPPRLLDRIASRLRRTFGKTSPRAVPSEPLPLLTELQSEKDPRRLRRLLRAFLRHIQPQPHSQSLPLYEAYDRYDILHFTGVNNLRLFFFLNPPLFSSMPIGWDVDILRRLGKKILYTNIGCLDGVSQSSFSRWGPEPICAICRWRDEPGVCSDERNLTWGALRNTLAHLQVNLGGNRVDYNDDPRVHELPEFYCLDPNVWRPDLEVPVQHRLPPRPGVVRIYHAVGNYDLRTKGNQVNIKTTHIIVPTVEKLKADGYPVELVFCTNIPNLDVRYYQVQSDIVVDMLTYGFFGANIREAMMLGKPAVCFLRPEWLESMRSQISQYVRDLPVVSATPQTVYDVLADLIANPAKRQEIGRRGREFMLRWHSREAAGRCFDRIYSDLMRGRKLRRLAA